MYFKLKVEKMGEIQTILLQSSGNRQCVKGQLDTKQGWSKESSHAVAKCVGFIKKVLK